MKFRIRYLRIATIVVCVTIAGLLAENSLATLQPMQAFTGAANENFGYSVSGAGDVNNDGYADFIVGGNSADYSATAIGRAYVYSGQTGGLLYTFTAEEPGDYFGRAVSGAGDVNNDGFADVLVGARWNSSGGFQAGKVYIYSGQSGALLYSLAGAPGERLGRIVSGGGDVNNDGFDDFAVGAPNGSGVGMVYVYSGRTGGQLFSFSGEPVGDWFGTSVALAGDVNNDGFVDLIIGAAQSGGAGRAYLHSGQNGALLYSFDGEAQGDFFGFAVSGAGDVDNDGYADVIIGAKWNDAGGLDAGRAYCYSGQTGSLIHTFAGESFDFRLGQSVAGAGDVNADGFDDVLVGAIGSNINGSFSGQATLFSGIDGTQLRTFHGEAAGDNFGFSVSSLGDFDNDGFTDVIIGAINNETGGIHAGRAYTLSLGRLCCATAGDSNHDDSFNIADVTFGIARIFSGGSTPACQDEADANGDNSFNIADVTYGIARIFSGGPAPICGTSGS